MDTRLRSGRIAASICILWASLAAAAGAQEMVLQCDAAHTIASFTLGDVLHTVHGTFKMQSGELRYDPATGNVRGEIVFDATSGQTGNTARDHKMHKTVLESERYPRISFRPDHADGKAPVPGSATLQVHGAFTIHGADHELNVPVPLKFEPGHWEASAHFQVPYAQWGMKNPSVLLLRVGDTVDIDLHAEGKLLP